MSQPGRMAASSRAIERPKPLRPKKRVPPAGSRQYLRTTATRKALLDSALNVFVRDGFEASRIEDIAAEAGRSRGSFYLNFANKADAFLALRDQQFLIYEERFQKQLQGQTTRAQQQRSVEEYMIELALDKSYILLELEFKLFAIRHPRLLKQVAKKHVEGKREIKELRGIFRESDHGTLVMQQRMLTFEAVLEGFALNVAFNSEVMTRDFIERCLPQLTRCIIDLKFT
jgi:AcrR family transcriptional regulator